MIRGPALLCDWANVRLKVVYCHQVAIVVAESVRLALLRMGGRVGLFSGSNGLKIGCF